MSTLVTSAISSLAANKNIITIEPGSTFKYTGAIVQTVYKRSDARSAYASPVTGNGTTITDLNLTITPKFSNSLLIMHLMLTGEIGENNVFLMHQDGILITTAGYESYNTQSGNQRWSGLVSARYDQDVSSTPQNYYFQYTAPAGSTSARTYAPAIRSANGTAQTFYFNRSVSSAGADAYEVGVSTFIITEVAQ